MKNHIIGDDGEVDLREFVRVLQRRKKIIFGVTLVAVLSAALMSFIIPKVYRADAIIEIGNLVNISDAYSIIPIEPPLQVKEKIEKSIYGTKAWDKFGFQSMPKIKAANTSGTSIVALSVEASDPEGVKNYLVIICDEIAADHKNKSEERRSIFQKKILETEDMISKLKIAIDSRQGSNTGYYLQIVELQRQLDMQRQLELERQLDRFGSALASVSNTVVIKQPVVSVVNKPRIVLNIALAAILGIFTGIFLAFVIDWWKKK